MSGIKGMLHYRPEIKQEAIRLFLEGKFSYREIAKRLNIRRYERIQVWVSKYKQDGVESHEAIGVVSGRGKLRMR